jgi:hypothetical protein
MKRYEHHPGGAMSRLALGLPMEIIHAERHVCDNATAIGRVGQKQKFVNASRNQPALVNNGKSDL